MGVYLDPFANIIRIHWGDDTGEITHISADLYISPKGIFNINEPSGPMSVVKQDFYDNYINPGGHINDNALIFPFGSITGQHYLATLSWTDITIGSYSAYRQDRRLWSGLSELYVTKVGSATKPVDYPLGRWNYKWWTGLVDPTDPARAADGGSTSPFEAPFYNLPLKRWALSGSALDVSVPGAAAGTEHTFVGGTSAAQEVRLSPSPPGMEKVVYSGGSSTIAPQDWEVLTDTFDDVYIYGDGAFDVSSPADSGALFPVSGDVNFAGLSLKYTTTVNGVEDVEATFVPIGFSTSDGSPYTMPLKILFARSDL